MPLVIYVIGLVRLRVDQWWTFRGWLICHYLRLFLFYLHYRSTSTLCLLLLPSPIYLPKRRSLCFSFFLWQCRRGRDIHCFNILFSTLDWNETKAIIIRLSIDMRVCIRKNLCVRNEDSRHFKSDWFYWYLKQQQLAWLQRKNDSPWLYTIYTPNTLKTRSARQQKKEFTRISELFRVWKCVTDAC